VESRGKFMCDYVRCDENFCFVCLWLSWLLKRNLTYLIKVNEEGILEKLNEIEMIFRIYLNYIPEFFFMLANGRRDNNILGITLLAPKCKVRSQKQTAWENLLTNYFSFRLFWTNSSPSPCHKLSKERKFCVLNVTNS